MLVLRFQFAMFLASVIMSDLLFTVISLSLVSLPFVTDPDARKHGSNTEFIRSYFYHTPFLSVASILAPLSSNMPAVIGQPENADRIRGVKRSSSLDRNSN